MQDMHNDIQLSRDDLRLMVAVADQGTVTRAALQMHLSQSALSHRLQSLEERVGGDLFRRRMGRMQQTAIGERLLQISRRLLAEFITAEDSLRCAAENRKPAVKLATECYTSFHWLPKLVRRLAKSNQSVEVQLVLEATRRSKAALMNGEVDAVLVQSGVVDTRFSYFPMFRDELVALVSNEHRLSKRHSLQPQDVANERLVLHDMGGHRHLWIEEFMIGTKVSPDRIVEVQLTEAIVEMVRANMGVTILAHWIAAPYVRGGGLHSLRLGSRGLWREWRIATLPDHPFCSQIKLLGRELSLALKPTLRSIRA